MLYFLVFLVPFLIFFVFLVRQNKMLSDEYVSYYKRVWGLASNVDIQLSNSNASELDVLITDDSIKTLEQDVMRLEQAVGLEKSSVISNTFNPKKKKLKVLDKRIKKAEESMKKEGMNA